MFKEEIVQKVLSYFPNFKIKFKNESWLMKLIGLIMFFNKDFMKSFTTTLGNTVYFPNEAFVNTRSVSSVVILMHETVHMHDAKKMNKLLFSALYASPQILAVLAVPLFLLGFKFLALLSLLWLLPIPSPFRMWAEKRAYLASLYAMKKLGEKNNFAINLEVQGTFFLDQFKTANYYFMWPFKFFMMDFDEGLNKIQKGERPFEDTVFDMLDEIIALS
jgi:uncharacterized membrane protein